MSRSEIKHYIKLVRKKYSKLPSIVGLANWLMIFLAAFCIFLLTVYEPPAQWHRTTFTLSHAEQRSTRGGTVLDIYTTDDRCFVLNENETEIWNSLESGNQYQLVYSSDTFNKVVKGLEDAERTYLDADEMRQKHEVERLWFTILLILFCAGLIAINVLYVRACIQEEKRRAQRHTRKKK